jgi:predicted ATPase/DNA-binding SARP family transcriptional activator
VRIALLGPLSVATDDGRVVGIGGARLRMLLARLALDAPRLVTTGELIGALWEQPPGDAGNALQSLISRLRKALRAAGIDEGVVRSEPAGYRLAIAEPDIDTRRFAVLARTGRAELEAGRPGPAATTLRSALGLYRGVPLVDVAEAPFAGPATARLVEARLAAVEDCIGAELELGRHAEVLGELDELTAAYPLREPLAALRLRALYGAGRPADALAGYAAIRRELADQLGVEPSPELRQVHLAVLRGDPEPLGGVNSAGGGVGPAAEPTVEPVAESVVAKADGRSGAAALHGAMLGRLTSFVGRDTDLTTAFDLLRGSRLVCLVGPGGAGKTRLATELSRRLVDREGVSVWFAELAPIGAGVDLAESVLGALGIREVRIIEGTVPTPQRNPIDRLVDHFTGRDCVLVLDNCEHLIDAAATLAETLLGRCPALRVLATSREPLAVTGEALHWVGPLDLPTEQATAEQARQTSSVRLFVDRASAARPGFTLDTSVLPAITEICHRLDGMPLALELAAARLRSMTPQQVAERLDDRFMLFTGGNRTALPRHRTLRGVVAWSWDLLTEPEAVLARRLAVFAGGITVDTATGICADAGLPAAEVPYLLASLVEKSLLEANAGTAATPRYRMLETVRAYGLERLAEAGETDLVMAAFLGYFVRLVTDIEPVLRTSDQLTGLAVIAAEHDNVIAALRWSVDHARAEVAGELVLSMVWYWILAGRPAELSTWCTQVLAVQPDTPRPPLAALRLVTLMVTFEERQLDDDVVTLFDQVLAHCDEEEFNRAYPVLAFIRPMLLLVLGRAEEAMACARRLAGNPDPWARAFSKLCVCFVAENTGDADSSQVALQEALDTFRALGERWGLCLGLSMDSSARSLRADYLGAVRAHEEALRLAAQLGSFDDTLQQRTQLAGVRLAAGELDAAEHEFQRVLAESVGVVGNERWEIRFVAQCGLVRIACRRGDRSAAHDRLAEVRKYEDLVPVVAASHRLTVLRLTQAIVAETDGDFDGALAVLGEAVAHARDSRDMPLLAGVAERVARVLMLAGGQAARAATVLGAAARLRGILDQGEPDVRDTIDSLAEQLGENGYTTAFRAGREQDRDDAINMLDLAVGRVGSR